MQLLTLGTGLWRWYNHQISYNYFRSNSQQILHFRFQNFLELKIVGEAPTFLISEFTQKVETTASGTSLKTGTSLYFIICHLQLDIPRHVLLVSPNLTIMVFIFLFNTTLLNKKLQNMKGLYWYTDKTSIKCCSFVSDQYQSS